VTLCRGSRAANPTGAQAEWVSAKLKVVSLGRAAAALICFELAEHRLLFASRGHIRGDCCAEGHRSCGMPALLLEPFLFDATFCQHCGRNGP